MRLLFATLMIFFVGCGGGGGGSNDGGDDNKTTPQPTKEPAYQANILDKYFYQQWYLEKNDDFYAKYYINEKASINAGKYNRIYTGKGIKVAIIDNGLDVNHEDLRGGIIDTFDIYTETKDVSPDGRDLNYHGTAVTGILGARSNEIGIRGVAPNSQILFLKHEKKMFDYEVVKLFKKAEEFGADVINCSWGTYNVSSAVREVVADLAKNGRNGKGISIIFAAGNDTREIENDESSIEEAIAVGSTSIGNIRAGYSNFGKELDIMAPGGTIGLGIAATDISGKEGIGIDDENYILADGRNILFGTSMAAPIVTGVIAMMLEANPNLTRAQIQNILASTADKIGFIEYKNGHNEYYGYGKINAKKAVDEAIRLR